MNRVGLGLDAHAFDATRPLVLGGVTIPDSPGLSGHSDADVLSHAVADAVLGAAGIGDLGELFSPTEEWRDASSLVIVSEAIGAARQEGWDIVNVDGTVILQSPRLAPYREAMQKNIAGALGVEPDVVSIKATTTDGLGFTGRGEGIAAMAVVLVQR